MTLISTVAPLTVSYVVISISMVLVNKYLFTHFPSILCLMFAQLLINSIIELVLYRYLNLIREPDKPHFNLAIISTTYPVQMLFAAMIIFNNYCLQIICTSTYQTARSFTVLFSALMSYFFLSVEFNATAVSACLCVSLGVFIGALDPQTLSLPALGFGCIGSFFWAGI
eukprot:Platyproteum_vivax@DN4702_c0_g1_i1.p1